MSRVVPHLIFERGDEPCVCRTPSVKRQLPASRWLPFMANRQASPYTTELIANQFHSFLDFNAGSSRRARPLARSVAVRQATRMPWPSVLPRLGQPNVPCGLYHQQRHRRCQTSPVRSEHGAYRALPRRDQGHEVASPQVEAPTADHSWRCDWVYRVLCSSCVLSSAQALTRPSINQMVLGQHARCRRRPTRGCLSGITSWNTGHTIHQKLPRASGCIA